MPPKNEVAQTKRRPPAKTPEARERQLVSLATDLAEKQLAEGTASSQVITHYLKLGTTQAQIEKQILEQQAELMKAKTEQIKSQKRADEMYKEALNAMRSYGGHEVLEDDDY